ncbi:Protein YrdA [Paenibacillus sp. JJ-100]|uniref:gamma carbonic anhydrase family protein n=1 Tax=Paenibacillus sp. JJ-100 TaxID=2974896 RepID=UPI0022FFB99B|nr:gamma carbonic anhydrase family protein [Paenibacillus sp. JJ-100]CAI6059550.1 Protein YrdA [Paenibacillus sp. JJ-100]
MIIPYNGIKPQLHPSIYIAEGSKLIGDLQMGEESSVWFNAVLRADLAPIKIGKRCNIQDNAVGHVNTNQPLILGDEVSVGHAAIIHGCIIGTGALIGMGAIILNGAEIGEYSLIGAGSVVTENSKIPPYTLALGTPARVIRELTEADLQRMSRTALGYVDKGREYRSS